MINKVLDIEIDELCYEDRNYKYRAKYSDYIDYRQNNYQYFDDALILGNIDDYSNDDYIEYDLIQIIKNKSIIEELKNSLSHRDYLIICMVYGLDDFEGDGMTYRDVGDMLGLSYQRIGQVVHKSHYKLSKNRRLKNWFIN